MSAYDIAPHAYRGSDQAALIEAARALLAPLGIAPHRLQQAGPGAWYEDSLHRRVGDSPNWYVLAPAGDQKFTVGLLWGDIPPAEWPQRFSLPYSQFWMSLEGEVL